MLPVIWWQGQRGLSGAMKRARLAPHLPLPLSLLFLFCKEEYKPAWEGRRMSWAEIDEPVGYTIAVGKCKFPSFSEAAGSGGVMGGGGCGWEADVTFLCIPSSHRLPGWAPSPLQPELSWQLPSSSAWPCPWLLFEPRKAFLCSSHQNNKRDAIAGPPDREKVSKLSGLYPKPMPKVQSNPLPVPNILTNSLATTPPDSHSSHPWSHDQDHLPSHWAQSCAERENVILSTQYLPSDFL